MIYLFSKCQNIDRPAPLGIAVIRDSIGASGSVGESTGLAEAGGQGHVLQSSVTTDHLKDIEDRVMLIS